MSNPQINDMYDAIYDGDCKEIDSLVDTGLTIDTRVQNDEWNFLHMALVSVSIPPDSVVIQHLIEIGVDVNAKDRHMWTPLHFAARTKNNSVIQILIDAGADVNALNNEGMSPLHLSLSQGPWSVEVTETFLAAGADLDMNGGIVRKFVNVVVDPDKDEILGLFEKYTMK